MSNYHDEIMNISLPNDLAIRHIVSDSQTGGTGVVYAYKCGQRDARHVAAEIAAQADARIAELEAKLNKLNIKAKAFLDETENGNGCTCFSSAGDVVPGCNYCSASMALSDALLPESEDF